MKMDKVAGSGNDEFYTPPYAIDPLLGYLKPNSRIWCPFDTERSLFVSKLREAGHEVANTHLDGGYDFFKLAEENKDWIDQFDYVISNPPYSLKSEVFKQLFELGKPFAMLVGVVGLFESQKRFEMFRDNSFEIMYFNRRISYYKSYDDDKPALNPPFSSVYVCSGILPQQIVFEEVEKK